MRIENITDKGLKDLLDEQLSHLRSRFINIFNRYFEGSDVQKAVDIDRRVLLTKYMILRSEMNSRGIKFFRATPIDREVYNRIFKASLWKLDVPALGDMVAIPNYVSICGEFIKSPVATEKIDIVIRTAKEHRNEMFEAKIGELVKEQTNKEPNFIYEPKGPDKSYIPLFDLVLKSHEKTRKMKVTKKKFPEEGEPFDIKKPYPNEHACRLREPGKFKEKPWGRTERVSDGKRYSIITGRLKGETTGTEQAYRYPKDTWTEAQARAHCKDHDGILFEPAEEVKKKDIIIKKPEETETTIRIPVSPECEVTATITIDRGQGITALYCGKIKKIRTYQFDKKKKAWTMASAKAWVKEHKEKTEKALGEGMGVGGDRQGVGGAELCICPKCGYEEEHERGEPCNKIKCPECGMPMIGKAQKEAIFKIVKVEKKKQIVGGIVYEPDEVDTQGDYTDIAEIEKAMHRFMEKYATNTNRIRINHKGKKYFFPVLECFQPESDTVKGDQPLKKGSWWIQIKILNKEIWKQIEDGTLTGFSMGGRAKT
ncbi:hypothetical protein ES703_46000 [subsurface metagenome]